MHFKFFKYFSIQKLDAMCTLYFTLSNREREDQRGVGKAH